MQGRHSDEGRNPVRGDSMQNGSNDALTVGKLVHDNAKDLKLRVIAGRDGLNRTIKGKDLHSPGLALSGFLKSFPYERVQLFGGPEITYLAQLSDTERGRALDNFFEFQIPCAVVTNKRRVPPTMIALAEKQNIPLISSSLSTTELSYLLSIYLNDIFAPSLTIHGTLVDVYGTGLLFMGRPGIGKSEIALDLVERGHRLVGDDIVVVTRKPPGLIIGTGPELLRHMIEIRGLGIINVRKMFGVRSIRIQKRVETIVELMDWKEEEDYERVGLEVCYSELLGVKIPIVRLPVYPGKNITVISETIALKLHLMIYGENAARELGERHRTRMQDHNRIYKYLQSDDE